MRVVFCWTGDPPYMLASWRALAQTGKFDLKVITLLKPGTKSNLDNPELLGDLTVERMASDVVDVAAIEKSVVAFKPDVIVIGGWHIQAYVRLTTLPALQSAKFIMTMDTPWTGTLRQRLGRFKIGSYLSRLDRVIATGERSGFFARALGVPPEKLALGMYGIDHARYSPLNKRRRECPNGWPRAFIFVGRYAPEKGLDILLNAYALYRSQVSDPWPLHCCGSGPLESLLTNAPGVTNFGYTDASKLSERWVEAGVFVLASTYDPWPLVVVEACAAGLPIICTQACGSAVELVRPYYNGVTVPPGNADRLADALLWMHNHHDRLPEMGARGVAFSAAYSADAWVERWTEYLSFK